jgi:phosphoserine phosphatase RsbU/P
MPNSTSQDVTVRFPIALKLILATATIVLLISLGFVIEGLITTTRAYNQFAAAQRDSEIAALKSRGLATVRQLGDAMYSPLLNGDIDLVSDAVQSVARGDSEIKDAVVVRKDGRVVARAAGGKLGETLPADKLQLLSPLVAATLLTQVGEALPEALSFGAPIEVKVGDTHRREGLMLLDMSTLRIREALQKIEADRESAIRAALIQTVLIGAAALLFGIIVAIFQGFRFSGAIRHLAHVAAEVGAGNLKARARARTRDEIGVLSYRFNEMTSRIENLLVESMAKAALDKELERANSIQALLMPSRERFTVDGATYCGWSETATQMGGDWWNHYPLSKNSLLLCVGDVTGHGIPSAMLTATTKACCDTTLLDTTRVDFPRMMRALDHAIAESGKGELVMTFFAAAIDTENMTVEFANAGHNFPLLVRGGQIKALVARGGRLGDHGDVTPVQQKLEHGDLIVMYTDGILECENEKSEEFGMRRFRRILQKHGDEDVAKLRDRILEEALTFFGNVPRQDDITLVLCRVN